jgi:hypothetical protein
MARTEKGRANRNRSREWNPAHVSWPTTERQRRDAHERDGRDARFKNITKPPWWADGEPIIDRGVAGVHLTSTWTDRWIGLGTSADVRKRALAYGELVARSRPVHKKGKKKGKPRPQWSDKAEHRPGLEQCEMRRRYARRLAAAGRSYNDGLRSHLKATCGPDFKPYTPGTHEGLYWRLTDNRQSQPPHIELSDPDPSFRPDPAFADSRGPTDERLARLDEPFGYQRRAFCGAPPKPPEHGRNVLLLALILPYQPAWFIVAVFALLRSESELPPRWYSCFVGLYDEITGLPKGNREVVESEVLSDDAIAGSSDRDGEDKRRGKKRQPKLPDWPVELELIKRAQAGDEGARNRILLNYQRKAAKIAKPFGTRLIPAHELVVVALVGCEDDLGKVTNGLLHALQKFDPENGGKFSSFATTAMEHAIYRYVERNPQQLSLNSNVSPG